MSSGRQAKIAASLLTATISTVMILPFTAAGDDGPGPGSSKGGKAMDKAPSGVELTTGLSEKISVDNSSGKTENLVVGVSNQGSKDSGKVNLLVAGFDGMTIKDVPGCTAITKADLPKGSNSAFTCAIDNLAAGKSASYKVSATFDLGKTGKICLPVTSADGKKTFWQQGPVPFGTTSPSPNAPVTPLLLGTENKPAAPAGDQGGDTGGDGKGGDKSGDKETLPSTGVRDDALPLGAAGAALLAAGGAGLWWSTRKPSATR
ncbi:hypothetical protein OKJ48_19610 [Streptomyces kunmingensis]|uniref:LPXTG-motif cell wall anchor domain-containing protein n=1 Tax=Streptomyces kunmingensis TaxID=68225 RepID=A0ABU6CCN5_9ACTN|nr:hypothetical protein [Streptomyces kunmingensis]MEB3962443.1 hypothetical protein [Streptomyces kunmingensis]